MLLHSPPIVIDDSSLKNAAERFTVALTLTLGGYKSAIALTKVICQQSLIVGEENTFAGSFEVPF